MEDTGKQRSPNCTAWMPFLMPCSWMEIPVKSSRWATPCEAKVSLRLSRRRWQRRKGSGWRMDVVNRDEVPAFITKDTSTIRELLAPRNSRIVRQSLAEATLPPGASTDAHYHPNTEEIY